MVQSKFGPRSGCGGTTKIYACKPHRTETILQCCKAEWTQIPPKICGLIQNNRKNDNRLLLQKYCSVTPNIQKLMDKQGWLLTVITIIKSKDLVQSVELKSIGCECLLPSAVTDNKNNFRFSCSWLGKFKLLLLVPHLLMCIRILLFVNLWLSFKRASSTHLFSGFCFLWHNYSIYFAVHLSFVSVLFPIFWKSFRYLRQITEPS